ncbi:MAG: general secretion pathway protein GspK [Planctomycetes bacterium]|nr:general secretion pathway protein GspK [Planctomycetota bacterium]
MKNKPIKTRNPGVTLLITLMALVILSIVVVQFQIDADLQSRATGYRIERLKCRYAAESGISLGSRIIKQYFDKNVTVQNQTDASVIMNLLSQGADPNQPPPEPNNTQDMSEIWDRVGIEEPLPWFVLSKETYQINGAEVTVEIHDENAKWPIVWLLSSPFDRNKRSTNAERGLKKYADTFRINRNDFETAVDLIHTFGGSLPLPPPPVSYSGTGLRMSPKGRTGGYVLLLTEEQDRHKLMGNFARYWYEHYDLRPGDPMQKDLFNSTLSFADCVSLWGAFHININTAPRELLETVFEPIGMSKYQMDALINYRQKNLFTAPSQLRDIDRIPANMRNNLLPLIVVKSRTFTVHVTATMGRTSTHLLSCVHMSHRAEAENLALVIRNGD